MKCVEPSGTGGEVAEVPGDTNTVQPDLAELGLSASAVPSEVYELQLIKLQDQLVTAMIENQNMSNIA